MEAVSSSETAKLCDVISQIIHESRSVTKVYVTHTFHTFNVLPALIVTLSLRNQPTAASEMEAQPNGRGCDTVLPAQAYRTCQGTVINECGATVD
jgi:hypothetical protein